MAKALRRYKTLKTYSVFWKHGGRVYSTQWARIPGATPAALPGPNTLRPLGYSYFRYVSWRVFGLVTVVHHAGDGVAYRIPLLNRSLIELGSPRLAIGGVDRWITFPIVGGLAVNSRPGGPPPEVSMPHEPIGPAGVFRLAARLSEQGLWIGVELEAFTPRLPPDSLPYRLVQLPGHEAFGRGFLRWWHAHLAAFAEPEG